MNVVTAERRPDGIAARRSHRARRRQSTVAAAIEVDPDARTAPAATASRAASAGIAREAATARRTTSRT
jgi:hypothetical protein